MNEDRNILINRLDENRETQNKLKEELKNFPKGHVNTLYRNGKGYYYLTYRDGQKIRNDYLGPVGKTDLGLLFNKLREREDHKRQIRALKQEEKELKKKIGRYRRNVSPLE